MRLPDRGGNWNNGVNAGVFYLNLNNPRSNVDTNLGFRCALLSLSEVAVLRDCIQYGEIKGAYLPADKAKNYIAMEAVSRLITAKRQQ